MAKIPPNTQLDNPTTSTIALTRSIGTWQAIALNVTMIVGAGVFGVIPGMLGHLPGPYALLGWIAAGALILVDGLIWSELGAALPGSGGSYHFLLECFGRERWGRLMAFLFIWQFLISGPLELGSGLVFMSQFATNFSPDFADFNQAWTYKWVLWEKEKLAVSVSPSRLIGFAAGCGIVVLLYRNITTLGRLTLLIWLGVLATVAWVLVEGWLRFNPERAFSFVKQAEHFPIDIGTQLGPAMVLAMYAYLGYYNVCYIGDEVRDPGRTIPRAILASALIVCTLFIGLHLAMLSTVPWDQVPTDDDSYSLPVHFMRTVHAPWAGSLLTLLMIGCVFGSAFAGLLGYSRIPYGASRRGHFFAVFAQVHPKHRMPHLSLLFVGSMMLVWSFFELQTIINALIVTRILEQFVAQIVGVMLLRRLQPTLARPFKIWLYPLPCLLALVGWLYMYWSASWLYIGLGAVTLASGVIAYFLWSWRTGGWPFGEGRS